MSSGHGTAPHEARPLSPLLIRSLIGGSAYTQESYRLTPSGASPVKGPRLAGCRREVDHRVSRRKLSSFTSLNLGGWADVWEAHSQADLIENVHRIDSEDRNLLLLGSGSNVVIADDVLDLDVVLVRTKGLRARRGPGNRVLVTVEAGEDLSDFVRWAAESGLAGVECLSGIPGTIGAAPVQNVGAYGQEIGDTVSSVVVWDRKRQEVRVLRHEACEFGLRDSIFKMHGWLIVLSVEFELREIRVSEPLRHPELATYLGVNLTGVAPLPEVCAGVVDIRARKGMLASCYPRVGGNVGSFFMNPVVDSARMAALLQIDSRLPHWPLPKLKRGRHKVSAAHLIETAGFVKGQRWGSIGISELHSLVLVHHGGGHARDLLWLAREVRDAVGARSGVWLVPEPKLVACGIDSPAP